MRDHALNPEIYAGLCIRSRILCGPMRALGYDGKKKELGAANSAGPPLQISIYYSTFYATNAIELPKRVILKLCMSRIL